MRLPLMTRVLGERAGVAAVEFALTVPVMLIAILGVIEFARAFWAQNALNYSVAQAARCMTIDTADCGTTTATKNYAASVSGYSFSASVFSATSSPASACGNQVSASYDFQFLTTLVNLSALNQSLTLTAQSCFPAG
jgi:Flp pilus assembly protein TadG